MKRMLGLVLAVLFASTALVVSVYAMSAQRSPSAAAAAPQVGVAPFGRNAFEYVGRIDQDGESFTSYGYLTYLDGMSPTDLYTQPLTPTETTARFTFSATATMSSRAVISNVFSLDADGELTIYFQESGGASFTDPASFAQGTPVAVNSVRFHNVLTVIGPNTGLANGIGELTQNTAGQFTLGATTYQFGQGGMQQRSSFNGFGIRSEPLIPRAAIVVAGDSMVTGYQTNLPLVADDQP